MFKIVLLSLALTGLQALPISKRLPQTHHDISLVVQDGLSVPLAEGFRQGTEPSRRAIVDLNTGLVQDYISETDRRTGFVSSPLGKGHGEMERRHLLTDYIAEEIPIQRNGGGWVRVEGHATLPDGFRQGTEPSVRIPDGFRQGTEPSLGIAEGFRQGTEPAMPLHAGYRQGTERFMPLPDGFRQGTEPSVRIPDGFRQGTEPSVRIPDGFRQGTEPSVRIPDGFRQGTEPSVRIPDGFRQGTELSLRMPDGFRQGTEPSLGIRKGFRQGTERFMPLPDGFRQGTEPSLGIPAGFRQGTEPTNPMSYREAALSLNAGRVNTIPDGFRQGTELSVRIPDGFRQGTEPSVRIPDGFRQGTEPFLAISAGFRQGTERFMPLPDDFRQGTEPSLGIPIGFRQGTEPTNPLDHKDAALSLNAKRVNSLPDGFRQGTEPSKRVPEAFRQGTERSKALPDGFRQGTEPTNPLNHRDAALSFNALPAAPANQRVEGFRAGAGPFMPVRDSQPSNHILASLRHVINTSRQKPNAARCNGEIINGRCYVFNPIPLPFLEAQDSCKSLNPSAQLASVTNEDLQARLVSMVTNGGQREPVMTWLGATVKKQRASWVDGSEWRYSDWMPGQPNIHTDKPVCVEMFRMDESWWTAADCDFRRASLCSYSVVA